MKNQTEQYRIFPKVMKHLGNEAEENFLDEQRRALRSKQTLTLRKARAQIKQLTGQGKKPISFKSPLSEDNHLLSKNRKTLRCEEDTKELRKSPERSETPVAFVQPLTGNTILQSKVENTLRKTGCNKAAGPDNVYSEMCLQLKGGEIVRKPFNEVHKQGVVPSP